MNLWILAACLSPSFSVSPSEELEPVVRTYLQDALGESGAGSWLTRNRIRVFGWVAAGLTANANDPADHRNALRVFDDRAQEPLLHQTYLAVERALAEGVEFSVGGRIALLYGSDARFLHQRGLADDQTSRVQFDPLEFWLALRIPIGRGIDVKVGRCTTPLGAEVIEAPSNALYSRTTTFGFAIPFTHTGIQVSSYVSDRVEIRYLAVLGWDVWDDANDSLSHILGMTVLGTKPGDSLTVNAIAGPEQPEDNANLRFVVDAVWRRTLNDSWSVALELVYGTEEDAAAGGDAEWYGAVAYVTRRLITRSSATCRIEWFRDADGTRVGSITDLLSVALGADLRPLHAFDNLRVRPEIRWDHAGGDSPFDGGSRGDQFTFAFDLIVTF